MAVRWMLIGACVLGVAGCSSMPLSGGNSGSVQLQSTPPGATATTSTGQTCQTPCSVPIASDTDFTVTFAQAGFVPQTVTVAAHEPDNPVGRLFWGSPEFSPNPVSAQLEAAPPVSPRKSPRPRNRKRQNDPECASATESKKRNTMDDLQ